jgi:hypothetical protein
MNRGVQNSHINSRLPIKKIVRFSPGLVCFNNCLRTPPSSFPERHFNFVPFYARIIFREERRRRRRRISSRLKMSALGCSQPATSVSHSVSQTAEQDAQFLANFEVIAHHHLAHPRDRTGHKRKPNVSTLRLKLPSPWIAFSSSSSAAAVIFRPVNGNSSSPPPPPPPNNEICPEITFRHRTR